MKKNELVNNSGSAGKGSSIPDTVFGKFNWGAFGLTFIWGFFNKTPITLLFLVLLLIPIGPLLNLFIAIWFGIKGNEWAWQNKKWESVEHFHLVQKKWAIASAIVLFCFIFLLLLPALIIPWPQV